MSESLPNAIAQAFQGHSLSTGRSAWLLVDRDGRLVEQGGELQRFGLSALTIGCFPRREISVLEALFDPHGEYEVLPRVEILAGIAVDLHRGRLPDGGAFLLLFDVSQDASKETRLRQRGLDLGRMLRELGAEGVQHSRLGPGWQEALRMAEENGPLQRERVAVVRVRLVDEGSSQAETSASDVLHKRQELMARALELLLERTGFVELDGSRAIQGWCGLLTEARDPAERALELAAALSADDSGGRLKGLAIGVASGGAVVGALTLPGGRRLAVLGPVAERACLLADQASPGEVLVDEWTAASSSGTELRLESRGSAQFGGDVHVVR